MPFDTMSIVKNRPDVKDQMCFKAYNFAGVLSLEDSKSNMHFYVLIYSPKKFFIILEAGVTTRI